MAVSNAIPLAFLTIAMIFYIVSREEDANRHKRHGYFILCHLMILASIISMAHLATSDSLTTLNDKIETIFVALTGIVTLEVFIWFMEILKDVPRMARYLRGGFKEEKKEEGR